MRTSIQWRKIADGLQQNRIGYHMDTYFYNFAITFRELTEKIEEMENEISELKRQLQQQNNSL